MSLSLGIAFLRPPPSIKAILILKSAFNSLRISNKILFEFASPLCISAPE